MPDPELPLSATTLATLRACIGKVIGPIEVYESLDEVVSESRSAEWQDPAAHGLWLFGRAASEDAWAIDTQGKEQIVVISHDLLWEEEVESPRDAILPVATTLAEAIAAARAGTLPPDYFTASEGEIPEEPEARITFDKVGSVDAGLAVPLSARAGLLTALLGAGTTATYDDLEEAFFELEGVERAVLALRYGMLGNKPSTVEVTAKALSLPADSVKEEEARGLRWLKRLTGRKK